MAAAGSNGNAAMPATAATAKASSKTAATKTAATQKSSAKPLVPLTSDPAVPNGLQRSYMVQLASLPSVAAATTEADRLQKKYAVLLKDVEVGVQQVDLGTKGIMQRVLAGPFDSFGTAKERCAQLSSQKQTCRVIAVAN